MSMSWTRVLRLSLMVDREAPSFSSSQACVTTASVEQTLVSGSKRVWCWRSTGLKVDDATLIVDRWSQTWNRPVEVEIYTHQDGWCWEQALSPLRSLTFLKMAVTIANHQLCQYLRCAGFARGRTILYDGAPVTFLLQVWRTLKNRDTDPVFLSNSMMGR